MVRVLHHRHAGHRRHDLLEHLKPFAGKGMLEDGEAGDVAARPRETRDKTVADRIGDLDEHDRDSLGLPVRRREHRCGACQDDAGA